jgi:hypothetical protein
LLYKCDLGENNVPQLFEFQIDYLLSRSNPTITVEIPNGNVNAIYDHEVKYSTYETEKMLEILPSELKDKYGEALVFIVFSIFHEIGHWKYICKQKFTPEEYQIFDQSYKEKVCKMKRETLEEKEMQWDAYRQIPSEAASDEYALKELEKCLNKILDSMDEFRETS